jgi:hypothetical protein
LSQLPALIGLLNQMRPWRSIARSLGVFSRLPSMRSVTTVVVPSPGDVPSKRSSERPPEQQPKRRPWLSKARPLVRLVPVRHVVIAPLATSSRRMVLAWMWVNSSCSPSQTGPSVSGTPRGGFISSSKVQLMGLPPPFVQVWLFSRTAPVPR